MPALFVRQTWEELKRMEAWYQSQGIKPRDIDFGGFVEPGALR